MELISTLIGVIVGFVLAALWEYMKDTRKEKKEGQGIRTILSQEIMYNVKFLTEVRDNIRSEEAKYKTTYKPDGQGGSTSEGNPIKVLASYHFSVLSQRAWEVHMQLLSSALSVKEIETAFLFYSNLNSAVAAQAKFHQSLDSPKDPATYLPLAYQRLTDVIKRIEATVQSYPKL